METLHGKHLILGITGGIAAYKSADLARRLVEAGAVVRVVMTRGAQRFITPLTLQAVSGQAVHHALFDPAAEAAMGHIALARWADAIIVAPASADFLARLTHGRADDLLTTLCLASEAPLAVAPAMNRVMWQQAVTQHNIAQLMQRGVRIVGPAVGAQACGETGAGRMVEPLEIVAALREVFAGGALAGVRVLITAGPTREALDPVRFISNRSSGKMGYALAAAAREAGAGVTLVSGPVYIPVPAGVECVAVESAQDMHHAVLARVTAADIFIATAAVADYRPTHVAPQKIKKQEAALTLSLERTPDIVADVAALQRLYTVGFAAETEDVATHARAKLTAKKLDLICANEVGAQLGFETDDNAITVFWQDGTQNFPRQPKTRLAQQLIAFIAGKYHARHSS